MKEENEVNETLPLENNNIDEVDSNKPIIKVLHRFNSIFKTNIQFSDTVINILTVSFGVLLATFLNHLVISHNEQIEVDQFLSGLYSDLEKDHEELLVDLNSFKNSTEGFNYYYQIEDKAEFEKDSIKKHRNFLVSYIIWFPNAGRFEGLKSSGKIYYIEDEKLRNEILDFYQQTAPVLTEFTTYYNAQNERLRIYIEEAETTKGIDELLLEPKGKIILLKCMALQKPIIELYEETIRKTEKIMKLIKEKQK